MSSKRIDMRKIITARFKLENIIDAFETISKHKDIHAKILIKP
jgi:threonine dehydrogenase-like Zn-dependent dehydrogenase